MPALAISGNQTGGRVDDGFGGAKIFTKRNHFGARKMLLEVENISNVRATPTVDALIGIAHHAQVAVRLGNLKHDRKLREVGVLIFIHRHILKAALKRLANGLIALQ